jgi:hypothetical protein
MGVSRIQIELEGYETVFDSFLNNWPTVLDTLNYKLAKSDEVPSGMISIAGQSVKPDQGGLRHLDTLWVDDFLFY